MLELRGIRKRYGGGSDGASPATEVLRGISLRIEAGEFVAIVGSSGSGKSTLMHLLGCLDRPSEGNYLICGQDVAGFDADQLAWLRREAFGFVFQGYHLIATETARENVEVPAIYAGQPTAARQARAEALLTQLGLAGRSGQGPSCCPGQRSPAASSSACRSRGGADETADASSLADEPTGALDSTAAAPRPMTLLSGLAAAGHTVIPVTHDRGIAAQARAA
ncbi:ABC transporter ATP-binding protein [Cupriavidus basilensis]